LFTIYQHIFLTLNLSLAVTLVMVDEVGGDKESEPDEEGDSGGDDN
jgi:hypothetical protein